MTAPTDPPPEDPKPDDKPEDPPPEQPADDEVRRLTSALAAERKARKKADEELEKAKREHMDEADRVIAEAEARGRAAALGETNARLLRAEIRAVAAAKLADPDDAVRLLDLDGFAPDDDGAFDRTAISGALDKLVEDKPYLAKSGGNGSTMPPKMPQGTRGTPGAPNPDAQQTDGDAFLRGLLKN